MDKKDFIAIAYVSTWVLIWGSVGSLIDFPLLGNHIYVAGSIGQISTFLITALITTVIAILLFQNFMNLFKQNKS